MSILSATNLETFYGPVPALRGVSIAVDPGEMVCVLGANGAGKTTLLNSIAGVVEPRFGTVTFDDRPLTGLGPDAVAAQGLVLCPEGRQMFPFMSVRENLELGAYRRQARASRTRNLDRVLHYFPRLAERIDKPAGMLSGGEQQMVAIGRAVMAEPRMLLLDEPSLGLSPRFVEIIYSVLAEINRDSGLAILVVEQNASVALEATTKGYVLELGRIVMADTCEVLTQSDVIRESFLGHGAVAPDAKRFRKKKVWR
ncbi:ABC transporter ATP-binding protein [Pseudooceanicola aestuarii]|uniref:ABC transporter ATP-binding protein n=1 Tax=Pseudooceanicola aestuarii TaxID=2697319 RepID=UPI0013D7833F|nr:ABC transporter ATP-binding protein [Pseudooceanicola aestuarii]